MSWLSPGQLLRTGREVAVSAYFAKYADKREAMAAVPGVAYDLSEVDQNFVIDYVADTGDGFNATYSVACSVTRALSVVAPPEESEVLEGCSCRASTGGLTAGSLLVLGGDQVYPVAAVRDYDERFKGVYAVAAAAGQLPAHRRVAAIPGNHDWYDGLVSFRRNFSESWINYDVGAGPLTTLPADERLDRIAEWRTFQSRSYFAAKLPHDWWLWGVDSQLEAQIDAVQMDYFRAARNLMEENPRSRVILAVARPSWCDDPTRNDDSVLSAHQYLCWFIDRMFPDGAWQHRVRLVLTGDKHHYARYHPVPLQGEPVVDGSDAEGPELVTCGGGGAFLSSTHHLKTPITPFWDEDNYPQMSRRAYRLCRSYPTKEESRGLRWRALLTPLRNPSLIPFTGVIYAVVLAALAGSMDPTRGWFPSRLPALSDYRLEWPTASEVGRFVPAIVAALILLAMLVAFAVHGAGGRSRAGRLAGLLHWMAHLGVLAVAADRFRAGAVRLEAEKDWNDAEVLIAAVVGSAGLLGVFGVVGALVMGLYLALCDLAGLHDNESFASFRYEGYKSHLRIHVTDQGLHVRGIGLRDVPKTWEHDGRVFWPRGGPPVPSEEIDAFVVRRGPDAPTRG